MKHLLHIIVVTAIVALNFATPLTAQAQNAPKTELPKIEEARLIQVGYSGKGMGMINLANRSGKVNQYFEIWEDKSDAPSMVTYVLVGDDKKAFMATWGKGPVNPAAFRCRLNNLPVFNEKTIWVSTFDKASITFQEIDDKEIKNLFGNLQQIRREWNDQFNRTNPARITSIAQNNVLGLVKEKTRIKWLERGWLQTPNPCMYHF